MEGVPVHGLPPDHAGPVDMLVLCQRSSATRNGPGTLSATAGGVVELDQDGVHLDTDDAGAPDILACVLREMAEEIGLPSESVMVVPVATFVTTLNGLGVGNHRGTGQVVACVLHLGTTPVGLAGLMDARHHASASRGAFEVESLEALAMLPGAAGLASFAATVREQAGRLDQHGVLSCFYAALRFYSEDVIGAFGHAFGLPWWAIPWSGAPSKEGLRLSRDVRQILPDEATLIEAAQSSWAEHWHQLARQLG